jgi:hypothetical protein
MIGHCDHWWKNNSAVLLVSRVTYEDPQAVGGLASALDSRKQSSEVVGLHLVFCPESSGGKGRQFGKGGWIISSRWLM